MAESPRSQLTGSQLTGSQLTGSQPTGSQPTGSRLTGGCQCGALRYAMQAEPLRACICHCRMCQKASGQPFMAYAIVPRRNLAWTRGAPSRFRSSNFAERGFCRDCGTPLTFEFTGQEIAVTLGSLDNPAAVAPTTQYGVESAVDWWTQLPDLPQVTSEDDLGPDLVRQFESYQHPDRDR